jgi:hypothetical protein
VKHILLQVYLVSSCVSTRCCSAASRQEQLLHCHCCCHNVHCETTLLWHSCNLPRTVEPFSTPCCASNLSYSVSCAHTGHAQHPHCLTDPLQYHKPAIHPLWCPSFLPLAQDFASTMETLNLDEPFPDLAPRVYHIRVDPLQPNRVWFTTR